MVFEIQESISPHSFPSCFRWHWQIIPIAPRHYPPEPECSRYEAQRTIVFVRSFGWLCPGVNASLAISFATKGGFMRKKGNGSRTISTRNIVRSRSVELLPRKASKKCNHVFHCAWGPKKGKLFRIHVPHLAFKKDLKRNEREVKVRRCWRFSSMISIGNECDCVREN